MTELIIERKRIQANAAIVKQIAGDAAIIGVVKGNGYGLGLVEFAQILRTSGIQRLAVSELAEAVCLREHGIGCEIMLLEPLHKRADLHLAIRHRLVLCLAAAADIQAAEAAALECHTPALAQLAVDTGFGRYSFRYDQAELVIASLQQLKWLHLCGVFSHLSDSSGRHRQHTERQYQRFMAFLQQLRQAGIDPGLCHLANSHGLLRFPETRLDAVRVGSALLGRLAVANTWQLQKVGWLRTEITAIYDKPAGSSIGYGNRAQTKRQSRIASLPVGYLHGLAMQRVSSSYSLRDVLLHCYRDGLGWLKKQHLNVQIHGQSCPLLGQPGSNSVLVDVTDVACEVGDMVRIEINPLFINALVPRLVVDE